MPKSNKKIARVREVAASKQIGGKATPGSGCFWNKRGDGQSEEFLLEDKFTNKEAYSLKLSILKKLESQAKKIGKIPVLRFGFETTKCNYAVIRLLDYNYCDSFIFVKAPLSVIVSKDSVSFKEEFLSNVSLEADNYILLRLVFEKDKSTYIVTTWDGFVEHVSDFIPS